MWVSPDARGLGLSRRLLGNLEARAAEHGARLVRLDTNAALTQAVTLYERSGYRRIPPYNDNAYATHWFEKDLLPAPSRSVRPRPTDRSPRTHGSPSGLRRRLLRFGRQRALTLAGMHDAEFEAAVRGHPHDVLRFEFAGQQQPGEPVVELLLDGPP